MEVQNVKSKAKLLMQRMAPETHERVAKLETSLQGLHAEFADLRSTLKAIESSLARSKETNWTVVFAGLAILGSLYAAAIRPLAQEIDRQRHEAESLALAVVVKEEKISMLKTEAFGTALEIKSLKDTMEKWEAKGVPIVDRRLSILENFQKQIEQRQTEQRQTEQRQTEQTKGAK